MHPNSVTKSIKYFNYCLNNIEDRFVFEQVEDILLASASEEFEELFRIIYDSDIEPLSEEEVDFIDKQKSSYIDYAKGLKIAITKIEIGGESSEGSLERAKVFALFFNKDFLIEESKLIDMEQEDEIWKIRSIVPFEQSN